MNKIISMFLCTVMLTGMLATSASAASGSSNMSVSAPAANSSGYIEYIQGDVMTFSGAVYAGMRSNWVHGCGLTQTNVMTPVGAIYYPTLWSSWDETYKTCLIGFAIPKSVDVSALTFVCNGEWRRLDGSAVIPSVPSAGSKPMNTPIKLSDSLSVIITKAGTGEAISGQTAQQNAFYLSFEPQGDVYSSSQYSNLYSSGYLFAPDGKQYRYATSSYNLGEPYVIGYLIPKSVDVSSLVFVLGDEVRALK